MIFVVTNSCSLQAQQHQESIKTLKMVNGTIENIDFSGTVHTIERIPAKSKHGTFDVPVINGNVPQIMERVDVDGRVIYRYYNYDKPFSAMGHGKHRNMIVFGLPDSEAYKPAPPPKTTPKKETLVTPNKLPPEVEPPPPSPPKKVPMTDSERLDAIMTRLEGIEKRLTELERRK
jgi:hypothetical protein